MSGESFNPEMEGVAGQEDQEGSQEERLNYGQTQAAGEVRPSSWDEADERTRGDEEWFNNLPEHVRAAMLRDFRETYEKDHGVEAA